MTGEELLLTEIVDQLEDVLMWQERLADLGIGLVVAAVAVVVVLGVLVVRTGRARREAA